MPSSDKRKARAIEHLALRSPMELDDLNDGEGINGEGVDADFGKYGYMLIERSKYAQTWVTLHATPQDAADYHDGQEYVEDWGDYELVDLDTGQEFYPEISTTWHPRESA